MLADTRCNAAMSSTAYPARPLVIYHSRSQQRITRMPVVQALLVAVIEGSKIIHTTAGELVCPAGQWLVLPAGQELTLTNQPDAHTGQYLALALAQQASWLQRFHSLYGHLLHEAAPGTPVVQPGSASRQAMQHLLAVQEGCDGPVDMALAEHAWQDLMLALLQQGQGRSILVLPAHDTRQQLQSLFSFDPAHRWTPAGVAHRLAMSEATLRRRLAAESATFCGLLTEIRLAHALALVMTGHQSMLEVALAAGYQSPSRFAAAFRRRFGLTPSTLRATRGNVSAMGDKLRAIGAPG
jgi:AraC-like DNA-binding protein